MSDLISRQKAIQKIKELPNSPNGFSATYDKASIILAIEDVEPVELVHAHWIERKVFDGCGDYYGTSFTCSKCNHLTFKGWNFCPDCGAKMDEEVE